MYRPDLTELGLEIKLECPLDSWVTVVVEEGNMPPPVLMTAGGGHGISQEEYDAAGIASKLLLPPGESIVLLPMMLSLPLGEAKDSVVVCELPSKIRSPPGRVVIRLTNQVESDRVKVDHFFSESARSGR